MSANVKQYSIYFSERIAEIDKIEPRLFRKVLLIGIIDTLSRAAFPTVSGHRQRVTQFIERCSGWHDHNRVSSQQLLLNLIDSSIKSGALYDLAQKKVSAWPDGRIIRPTEDLSFQEADSVAAPAEKVLVKNATYLQLFYTYRNHLVHEFREPGYGMELSQDPSTPYYHGMKGEPWQLVFSDSFIKGICSDCLNGLVQLLLTEKRNPYDCYEFGSLWCRR